MRSLKPNGVAAGWRRALRLRCDHCQAENLVAAPALNHRTDSFGGVLAEECGALLKEFFATRR